MGFLALHFGVPITIKKKKKRASFVAQLVKNLPAMQETWVQSLGWEDPLEKGKATHWRIPWQSMGSQSRTQLNDFHFTTIKLAFILHVQLQAGSGL